MENTKEVEPPVEPKKELIAKPIAVNERGALMPANHLELKTLIEQIAAGGGFPARFDTMAKRIAAYSLAVALGGNRWQLVLNNMASIKDQLVIYGEAPGALAERTGQVEEKHVYVVDKEYNEICSGNKNLNAELFAAICFIQRKGRVRKEFSYSLEEAMTAGQYPAMKPEWVNKQRTGKMIPNNDSPWMKATKVMLMRKAMGMGLKFEFPDALIGTPIAEYDFDEAPDITPIREVSEPSIADELNEEAELETK